MQSSSNPPIIDLAYCEVHKLMLHPNRLYRFTPHGDCATCMRQIQLHDAAMACPPSAVLDTSEPKEEFAYSRDQEEYWGSFATRGDAVAEAIDGDADLEPDRLVTISTGRVRHAMSYLEKMTAARIGERIIEQLDEDLAEEIASDDVIVTLTHDQQETLGLLVLDFVKHNAQFHRWGVDQVEEHTGCKA